MADFADFEIIFVYFSTISADYLRIKNDELREFCIFAAKFRNMKVLTNIKIYALRIWHSQFLKYAVVCIIGVAIVGYLDDNSIWNHLKNLQRIDELTAEKERYLSEFERDQKQIKELDRNPKAIEKIARERYFMKEDNEDIFILSDDERVSNSLVKDETAK